MSRKLRPLAALAVIALLSAGCSNAPAETGTGGNENADNHEKAVKFAQCMRDNGVEDFPDPTENGPLIDVEGARSKPGFEAAVEKCRDEGRRHPFVLTHACATPTPPSSRGVNFQELRQGEVRFLTLLRNSATEHAPPPGNALRVIVMSFTLARSWGVGHRFPRFLRSLLAQL